MNFKKKILFTFISACVVGSICISLLEVGLRIVKPQPVSSRLSLLVGSYYVKSEFNDWTLSPNYSGTMQSMERPGETVRVSINSRGFRGGEIDNETNKIVVLGDSYTFGVYVDDEETFTERLNGMSQLDDNNLFYINAGFTGGLETDQHFVWLVHNIDLLKPTTVIYATFPPNDISGINRENWAELNIDGMPIRWESKDFEVTDNGAIANISLKDNVVLKYVHATPILRESHLAVAIARTINLAIHGSRVSADSYNFLFGLEQKGFREKQKTYLKLINQMAKLCSKRNIEFKVALFPINFLVEPEKRDLFFTGMDRFDGMTSSYYSELEEKLNQVNIETINIERLMKASDEGPFFPENGEPHYDSSGHLFVAKELYRSTAKN